MAVNQSESSVDMLFQSVLLARISHDGVRVKGEQAQINENRDELEHSAPWRSNSLGKLSLIAAR
jgi:hypothetical protein